MQRFAGPAPGRAPGRVRWGIPDAAIAWGIGLLASLFAGPFVENGGKGVQPASYYIAAVVATNLGIAGALVVIARRKGRGGLARDFGLVEPVRTLGVRGAAVWLAAGVGLSLGASALLAPILEIADLGDSPQEISRAVERASGVSVVLLGLAVAFVAPVVEELLFRGVLLRSLARRWSASVAVFASALVFAAIHLMDPDAGYVLPGLLLLGLVSGYQAQRSGNLARSVLLHVGFNLVATITLVFDFTLD